MIEDGKMGDQRDTWAYVNGVEHRLKAAATLLSICENTLRTTLVDSGIPIRRARQHNPIAPAVRLFDLPSIFEIAAWLMESAFAISFWLSPVARRLRISSSRSVSMLSSADARPEVYKRFGLYNSKMFLGV